VVEAENHVLAVDVDLQENVVEGDDEFSAFDLILPNALRWLRLVNQYAVVVDVYLLRLSASHTDMDAFIVENEIIFLNLVVLGPAFVDLSVHVFAMLFELVEVNVRAIILPFFDVGVHFLFLQLELVHRNQVLASLSNLDKDIDEVVDFLCLLVAVFFDFLDIR
jgi:hypothetical protein